MIVDFWFYSNSALGKGQACQFCKGFDYKAVTGIDLSPFVAVQGVLDGETLATLIAITISWKGGRSPV